jgi:alkaline phosphatase D
VGSLSRRAFIGRTAAGAVGLGLLRPVRSLATSVLPAFTSGVASGDPSTDGVVLWTRVDPAYHGRDVAWEVLAGGEVLQAGATVVDGDRDGTVHLPVGALPSGATLTYRFTCEGQTATGATRTLPSNPEHLRIGVVSCSKYSDGYFNAYRALAGMDCDLVLHLGDYIYASASGRTGDPLGRWDTVAGREHQPDRETAVLADYRTRYQQYRADPDLQLLHASVPVVAVWDDNDIANNAYRDGDQAGDVGAQWAARKRDGQQAWSEYHPTRAVDPAQIWRRIIAGDLLDLTMLDTRLQRDQQVSNAAAESSAANDDPSRTMLGAAQKAWLLDALQSDAAWRVVGQGIVMAHWRIVGYPEQVGRALGGAPLVQDEADAGVYWNSDGWDGYAYERARLFEAFAATGDTIVLTGDVHSSWANELVPDADPLNDPVGIEMVAPAVSTRPFASNVYGATPPFEAAFTAANPWIKWCDMDANGFLVVDLDADRAVGRWFQVDAQTRGAAASPLMTWVSERGSRRLLPGID